MNYPQHGGYPPNYPQHGGYPPNYPQHGGWQSGGPPPGKSNTGVIVAVVAAVIVLVGVVGITGFVAPGFFLAADYRGGGSESAGPGQDSASPTPSTGLPTYTRPGAEDVADVPVSEYIDQLPEDMRGCDALTDQQIQQLLVENIGVVQDLAKGSPEGSSEEYYCSLDGSSEQDKVNQKGLIARDLTVNVFRTGRPDMPTSAAQFGSRWKLVKTMAIGDDGKEYDLPDVSEALIEYHPRKDISSVTLLARVKNVIIWVGWNNTDISREQSTEDADRIMRMLLDRLPR